jgi:hypothetical protein
VVQGKNPNLPRNFTPEFLQYVSEDPLEVTEGQAQEGRCEAHEKSGQHNRSDSVSARPSLVCAGLSVGKGDMASTHGGPEKGHQMMKSRHIMLRRNGFAVPKSVCRLRFVELPITQMPRSIGLRTRQSKRANSF